MKFIRTASGYTVAGGKFDGYKLAGSAKAGFVAATPVGYQGSGRTRSEACSAAQDAQALQQAMRGTHRMSQGPSVRYAGDVGLYEQEPDPSKLDKLVKVMECIAYIPLGFVALIVIGVARLAKGKE